MKVAPLPEDEKVRLDALKNYQILDTFPEMDFDDFTKVASHICGTPIALISLVDESRQWFKSRFGLDAEETPRDLAFCSHAILHDDVFVVLDSFKDERFHDNPLAVSAPHVRFYAGAPLNTPSGHRIGTLCVIDSKPREFDKERQETLKAIARQVINQMELRLLMKEAQKAAKTKSLFLATMSHEIRTPLNGILGCANILLDRAKEEEDKKLAQTITGCGDTLLTLINDILDFSKLESGKMEVENEAFSLSENVEQIIQLFNSQALKKSISLNLKSNEKVPKWIYGDVIRIRQILSNLISNAIKFTESGRVDLILDSKSKDNEEHEIKFSVKDSGIGINKEAQKKLFVSFSQVDASAAKKFGGTGLGLTICKALTELMGGNIWVDSEEGKGSTFHFTINAKQAKSQDSSKQRSVKFDSGMALEHPLKILMAEDNSINQLVAKKTLEKLGYRIDVASNGIETLQMLKSQNYDIVLMDCSMPEMDGLEATKKIKENPSEYNTPRIVALTASALKEDRDKCTEAGMDDFLSKPLNIQEIVRVLRDCKANESLREKRSAS